MVGFGSGGTPTVTKVTTPCPRSLFFPLSLSFDTKRVMASPWTTDAGYVEWVARARAHVVERIPS